MTCFFGSSWDSDSVSAMLAQSDGLDFGGAAGGVEFVAMGVSLSW